MVPTAVPGLVRSRVSGSSRVSPASLRGAAGRFGEAKIEDFEALRW